MEPSRNRPVFISPDAVPQDGLPRDNNPDAAEKFQGSIGEVSLGPTIHANRSPVDLPDEFPGVVPEFRSRRKAEALPKLRPAESAKGFDWGAWQWGFLTGTFAMLAFAALLFAVFRGLA
jgi:hypothetical protein